MTFDGDFLQSQAAGLHAGLQDVLKTSFLSAASIARQS
jgi:hypothetical protein